MMYCLSKFQSLRILTFTFFLSMMPYVWAEAPLQGLKVKANHIVGALDGQKIVLKGASFHQLMHFFPGSEGIIKFLKEEGSNVIRIPYDAQGSFSEEAYARTKFLADLAFKYGLYVILDFHPIRTIEDHPEFKMEAQAFFKRVLSEYDGEKSLILELWNEPTDIKWEPVKTYAIELIKFIRDHERGERHLIIVGTPSWSSAIEKMAEDPLDAEQFPDIAYALHNYASSIIYKDVYHEIASKHALFATEWAPYRGYDAHDPRVDMDSLDRYLELFDCHGISWTAWSASDEGSIWRWFNAGSLGEGGKDDKDLKSKLSAWGRFGIALLKHNSTECPVGGPGGESTKDQDTPTSELKKLKEELILQIP